MPNIIGRPTRQPRLDLGEQEYYIGHAAITGGGGNHNITSPIQRGLVTDWKDMEKVWHQVFYRELTVVPEETPVSRPSSHTNRPIVWLLILVSRSTDADARLASCECEG